MCDGGGGIGGRLGRGVVVGHRAHIVSNWAFACGSKYREVGLLAAGSRGEIFGSPSWRGSQE